LPLIQRSPGQKREKDLRKSMAAGKVLTDRLSEFC
jgi:hypothetical protein